MIIIKKEYLLKNIIRNRLLVFDRNIYNHIGGVMAKVLDYDLEVSEFELQSRYYVDFRTNTLGKDVEHPYSPQLWAK